MLHFFYVQSQKVFACQLLRMWEVVYFLGAVQSLVKIGFALSMGPEGIPVMPIRTDQPIQLQHKLNKFGLTLQHFIKSDIFILPIYRVSLHRKVRLVVTHILNFLNQCSVDVH